MKNLMNNIEGLDAETRGKLMEKIMADPALKTVFLKQAEKDPKMKGILVNLNKRGYQKFFLIRTVKKCT
jgi:hypothetical protein